MPILKHKNREGGFYVYIVQAKDGSYYTGSTRDVEKRVTSHNKGNGARYLRFKLPVQLVYVKEYRYYKNALHAERNLKKLTRFQKEIRIKSYESRSREF